MCVCMHACLLHAVMYTWLVFSTDHVFGTSVTTDHIYQKLAEPIVEGVMEGINGEGDRSCLVNYSHCKARDVGWVDQREGAVCHQLS